ncbi:hypothetical protein [Nostoc sp. TCL240-02]|uniref:hypothetical protein n=1 Tax=Nostoc sp. TCL240-02 TaxID=2572090 RepID=UPI00157FB3FA|nr:hypothetical protein [Nostoc sp. TCL240-02]QKQ76353.1 hypothetical protein FBB35_26450 [Nostoc sp. TCL240-02]
MNYQQKFANVKRIYHDRRTGLTSHERQTRQQTCFDSTAEYLCYSLISKYFKSPMFDIDVHNKLSLGEVNWSIDFQVTARRCHPMANAILAELVNTIHDTNHASLAQIFIEYKGFQDKNFLTKMENLVTTTPTFAKTIILVSDHNTAFGCWDYRRNRFYTHPIISTHVLQSTLTNIIN